MPRPMPALASQFGADVSKCLALAKAGELALAAARTNEVVRYELRPSTLEAIYELAFLRVFLYWESFLEDSMQRLMCGYALPTPGVTLSGGPYSLVIAPMATLAQANAAILGRSSYVSWAPAPVISRSRAYINNGPHELVLQSATGRLEWLVAVRNRIAHPSEHARREFDRASMGLVGRRYRGSSPGRLLRDWDFSVTLNVRMLVSLSGELVSLAGQIAP